MGDLRVCYIAVAAVIYSISLFFIRLLLFFSMHLPCISEGGRRLSGCPLSANFCLFWILYPIFYRCDYACEFALALAALSWLHTVSF